MIVLEFKDGPNKGKQIVLPTPDNKAPEINLVGFDHHDQGMSKDLEYLRNKMMETTGIPSDRLGRGVTADRPHENIWKRFIKKLRGY